MAPLLKVRLNIAPIAQLNARGSAQRLLAALLPHGWHDGEAMLGAAEAVDRAHDDGADVVLSAWDTWRRTDALPAAGAMRDIIASLVELLGGVGVELRARPRAEQSP